MRETLRVGIGIAVGAIAVVIFASVFVVQQTQQALVFRFGSIVRAPIMEPGLYFKVPFIENVVTIDKRIIDLELPQQEVIASDQKRLVVDAFARYKITDPLRFFQSVSSVTGANLRLTSIVNSSVRTILADATMTTVVRSDRAGLMRKIRDDVNRQAQGLGLNVVDVRLRRADLPEQNSQAVFQRMQTERQREAADIRAQGSQMSQGIKAKADRDVVVLRAEATQIAEKVRGEGDAQKNRILAEAYGKDPDFFAFYRSMQAYETSMKPGETRMILNPDSEFMRYFKDPFQAQGPQERVD